MKRPVILLTGAHGQLGFELARALAERGDVVALDRAALDLGDADAVAATVRRVAPQVVVNAAAYTAVDRAESEPALAEAINARAPEVLAAEARRLDALLIHYSTDYVFDGASQAPYDEDAAPNPLNVYGRSKLAGERAIGASGVAHLVLRTSWVYGWRGQNFLLTMKRLGAEREELRIVADQFGVPNWSRALAEATAALLRDGVAALAERSGTYHMSARGRASWYDFACAIFNRAARPRLVPIATADYPTAARRPASAVLATAKFERTFGFALPDWREMLATCLAAQ
ncbi:MAG TPA: dTDP-4-dehydrorhamnose reductase [Casimicrobiaceae bacterium]|nr:dTDP-4-dehydrorhamnose reductase [Casimicrobiaceae bacterium]